MDNTDYKVTSRSHPPGAEGGGLVPQVYPRVHEVSPVYRPPPLAALVPAKVDHRPGRGWMNASVPEDQSETCIRVTWSNSTNLPVDPSVRHHVEVLFHVALLTDLCPPVVPEAPARNVRHYLITELWYQYSPSLPALFLYFPRNQNFDWESTKCLSVCLPRDWPDRGSPLPLGSVESAVCSVWPWPWHNKKAFLFSPLIRILCETNAMCVAAAWNWKF